MKGIDRGKRLDAETLKKLGEWGRYKDVDGDGIAYRTVPGDGMPAYFTRGSGHNAKGQYSERPDDYVENVDRLARKFEGARKAVPQPVVETVAGREDRAHRLRHLALGDRPRAAISCSKRPTSRPRTSACAPIPSPSTSHEFIDGHERVYIIEQNRDAQLLQLMRLELTPERIGKLRSVLHYSGLPLDARSITEDVLAQEGYEVAKKTTGRVSAGSAGGE